MAASTATILVSRHKVDDETEPMSQRKKQPPTDDKAKVGRPKSNRKKGEAISTRLDPEWADTYERYCNSFTYRPSDAEVLREAVIMLLTARGFMPEVE